MERKVKVELINNNYQGELIAYFLINGLEIKEKWKVSLAILKWKLSDDSDVNSRKLCNIFPEFYQELRIKITQIPELSSEVEDISQELEIEFNKDIFTFISEEQIKNAPTIRHN